MARRHLEAAPLMGNGQAAGRRPGPTQTRALVLTAARQLFSDLGYDRTTIRGIAREAGVDPALVHHFFGRKEDVFLRALEIPFQPADLIARVVGAGPRNSLAERLLRVFLSLWEDPGSRLRMQALIRSATTSQQGADLLRQFLTATVLSRIADAVGVPRLRITLVGSQLVGIAIVRYVLGVEPLASASQEEIVKLVAPSIQRYLDS
ncbi:MAG: TetR family transcriptional regulator [Candidatus Dormibacteraeota bacterium]|nr:TetR family transcriptional regulator [Candidatus Dormibacteraeota bacterium]